MKKTLLAAVLEPQQENAQYLRFNASCQRGPSDMLEEAVADDLLEHMDDDIVPVVRCLAILGSSKEKLSSTS